MVNRLLLPQEIETFYVIPTLRKHLALALKKQGMKQKDIANIFGINSAAISQYTSNKRGDKVTFDETVLNEISIVASRITTKYQYMQEIQNLLRFIRESKALCKIHKSFSEVPENCDPHQVGCHTLKRCCNE